MLQKIRLGEAGTREVWRRRQSADSSCPPAAPCARILQRLRQAPRAHGASLSGAASVLPLEGQCPLFLGPLGLTLFKTLGLDSDLRFTGNQDKFTEKRGLHGDGGRCWEPARPGERAQR